jgi:hypothetical protein
MSATPKCFSEHTADLHFEQDIVTIREWERFKWLARGLWDVADHYSVAQLEELLDAAPEMPGQHEKVLVLLAIKATPQSIAVLESLDTGAYDEGFRELHKVALDFAESKRD